MRTQSTKTVVRKIKFVLSSMTLREIVTAYKKSCFPSLHLKAIVSEELRRRPIGPGGVMGKVVNECAKAYGKYLLLSS